jgi:hypothetical protein
LALVDYLEWQAFRGGDLSRNLDVGIAILSVDEQARL